MELIQTIRNEIERRITDNTFGAKLELIDILAWLDTLQEPEVKPNEELKKAAEEYAKLDEEGKWKDGGKYKGFIAGAKWQAEKCDEETSKLLYAERQTAYIHGWDDHKDQMMKEAVEGFIFQSEDYYPKELITRYDGELKHGDKVRVIICKKEDL